ncbi:MAG: hypothetical protein JNK76_09825 [Planctomycetales bacterium]|nr:hypothetical protein [Planctomycetales bacterium]MBN8628516.1 hypothetical protein [Planctomycetota bacterium]
MATSHNFDLPLTIADADDIVRRLTENKMRVSQFGDDAVLHSRDRDEGRRLTREELTRRGLVRVLIDVLPEPPAL